MKICALLLLLVAHQCFAHYVTISHIRNLWKRRIAPVAGECALITGVNQKVVDRFFKYGQLPNDPFLKCFILCVDLKFQLVDSAGEINAKKVVENFDYIDYPLAQKCANIIERDPCQKTYLAAKCLHDDLSARFPEFL